MLFQKEYEVKDPVRWEALCASAPFCLLVTVSEEGRPHVGVFNPLFEGETCFLHLQKKDEQLGDLRRYPKALLCLFDFHAVIPSYWVDKRYAGAATAYYRYVEWECDAQVWDAPETVAHALEQMMKRYQPEGGYAKLDPHSEVYRESLARIVGVKLTLGERRTKWKFGQNRDKETRERVKEQLLKRGDDRTAKEMEDGSSRME